MSDAAEFPGLLEQIDDAFNNALGPIPARLSEAARDAFAWRTLDAALAELEFDSASGELVGIRGTSSERRSLRYSSGDFVIRVHMTTVSLMVMVEPPLAVDCRVVTEAATDSHRTDELGELLIGVPGLPIRLEFDLPAGTTNTPWITG
jgi:hypothetical protein